MRQFFNRRSSSVDNIYINNSGYKIQGDEGSVRKSGLVLDNDMTSDFGGPVEGISDVHDPQYNSPFEMKEKIDNSNEIGSTRK